MKLSNDKAAYIAGFFDGEGCLTFHSVGKSGNNIDGRSKCYSVSCSISNNNIESILFIKDIIGGKIYETIPKNIKHSINYRLVFTNMRDIHFFLSSIKKFLIIKKPHAEIVIKYLEKRMKKISIRGQNFPITNEEFSMMRNVRQLNLKDNKRTLTL